MGESAATAATWHLALSPVTSSPAIPIRINPTPTSLCTTARRDTIERVSLAADGTQSNGYSAYPSISADGRYVAFNSTASNLVPGDTNAQQDVFVYDRQTDSIQRVSLAADGTQGNVEFELFPAQRRRPLCGVQLHRQQPRPR